MLEKALFESKPRVDGEALQCFDHHKYIVWTTSLWMNTLFTASYDCTVSYIQFDMISQVSKFTQFSEPKIIEGPEDWVNAFGADPKAEFLATHDDETHIVTIWNIHGLSITVTLEGHTDDVQCIKFVRKERLILTGGGDTTVKLWDFNNGQCLRTLSGHRGTVWCIDINRHRIVSGGRHGEIMVWAREYSDHPEFHRLLGDIHPFTTAIGRICLEPTQLITTDGNGMIIISDFWQKPSKVKCGCKTETSKPSEMNK